MKTCFSYIICILMLLVSAVSFGADSAPATAVPVVADASLLIWAKGNLTGILGILLAMSELMAASPWFKGNGILDSITKSLKFLLTKEQPSA